MQTSKLQSVDSAMIRSGGCENDGFHQLRFVKMNQSRYVVTDRRISRTCISIQDYEVREKEAGDARVSFFISGLHRARAALPVVHTTRARLFEDTKIIECDLPAITHRYDCGVSEEKHQ